MLKIKHPAPFCGKLDKTLALIYAEKDGVRYNVRPKDEEGEGSAAILVEWDKNKDYSQDYEETDIKTFNPQPLE